MAAVDPLGSEKYWINGFVWSGLNKSSTDQGTIKFWSNGFVGGDLFPVSGAVTVYPSSMALMGIG